MENMAAAEATLNPKSGIRANATVIKINPAVRKASYTGIAGWGVKPVATIDGNAKVRLHRIYVTTAMAIAIYPAHADQAIKSEHHR